MKNFIPWKFIWPVLLVAVIVFILITLLVLNNKKPVSQPALTPIDQLPSVIPSPKLYEATGENKSLGVVNFSTDPTIWPNKMALYYIGLVGADQTSVGNLGNNFGFTEQPISQGSGDDQIWIWQGQSTNNQLTIVPKQRYIEYINNGSFGKSSIGAPDYQVVSSKDDAFRIAKAFLEKNHLYGTDLVGSPGDVVLYGGSAHPETVSNIAQTDTFRVSFGKSVDNYPIYLAGGDSKLIDVWVDLYGQVNKISAIAISPIPSGQERSILTNEEMVSAIKSGQATIIRYNNDFYDQSHPGQQFDNTNIRQVSLAYLADYRSGLMMPIFRIEATAFYASDKSKPVELLLYLPALKQ